MSDTLLAGIALLGLACLMAIIAWDIICTMREHE